jgi:hypothetical protein
MFGRLSIAFIIFSIAAFFCTQSVEAAKGPKITKKVYFDIKHGDKDLGRSMALRVWNEILMLIFFLVQVVIGLYGGVSCVTRKK